MFSELDFVRLKRNQRRALTCSKKRRKALKGAVATIVEIYERPDYATEYELEFVMPDGKTLGLLTVRESEIEYADVGERNDKSKFKEESSTSSRTAPAGVRKTATKVATTTKKLVKKART